jgi:hypothetical protein
LTTAQGQLTKAQQQNEDLQKENETIRQYIEALKRKFNELVQQGKLQDLMLKIIFIYIFFLF